MAGRQQNREEQTPGRSVERREQILEAACTALAQVGYEKITTRRIAQQAGVNIATLHYHFGTKEKLLAEAMRYGLYRAESLLRDAMSAGPNTADALTAGFQVVWQIAKERPGLLRYDLILRALRDADARYEAIKLFAVYRKLVEEVVERHVWGGRAALPAGVTPQTLAHYVVAAVDGILLQHLVTGDDAAARTGLSMVQQHALLLLNQGEERDGDDLRG